MKVLTNGIDRSCVVEFRDSPPRSAAASATGAPAARPSPEFGSRCIATLPPALAVPLHILAATALGKGGGAVPVGLLRLLGAGLRSVARTTARLRSAGIGSPAIFVPRRGIGWALTVSLCRGGILVRDAFAVTGI